MPVIVWIIAAIAIGVVSIVGGIALDRWMRSPDVIALIGRSGAGKSTFAHVLEHGDVPKGGAARTLRNESHEIPIENKTFIIVDSPGDRLDEWAKVADKASGVIYFFDISLILQGEPEALSAMESDADHIRAVYRKSGGGPHFTIVGTHEDQVADKSQIAAVREILAVARLMNACGSGSDAILIGSLVDKKRAVRLATQVAKHQTKS